MFIAHEKRKTNIAEYILYMWQIEDLIRACEFDMDKINQVLIDQYQVDPSKKEELKDWYQGISKTMQEEGLHTAGHIQVLVSLIDDLNDFHFRLVDSPHHSDYQKIYLENVRNISEFRKRMGHEEKISDMEVCLTGLYGLLLMRLKKKSISEDTVAVLEGFSKMLAETSRLYKEWEEGKLDV